MAKTLADLDLLRPVDPDRLCAEVSDIRERQRAWQLRELRTESGLTQSALAQAMRVGQNRVSQIESGGAARSRLETLRKYAEALGGELSVEITVGGRKYPVV